MYMCGTCILLCCVVCVYRLVCAFHLFLYLFFFFFKQKTAYEMRISDWSSDVCSSDLVVVRRHRAGDRLHQFPALGDWLRRASDHDGDGVARAIGGGHDAYIIIAGGARRELLRSEEHTSELQSLMRISYAVFCLQNTKQNTEHTKEAYKKSHTHVTH